MATRVYLAAGYTYLVFQDDTDLSIDERYPADNIRIEKNGSSYAFYRKSDGEILQNLTFSNILDKQGSAYSDEDKFFNLLSLFTGEPLEFGPNFNQKVTMGLIPGHSVLDKFGFNLTIATTTDPEDIWEGGGEYTYDDFGTAPIESLASNNAADTEPISVQGLDIDGNLVTQEITLQGATRVALTTALWRVFRMENEGTSDLVGTVFCYTGTGTVPSIGDPEVRAVILSDNNQTQMALYTIPKGKVGFLYRGEFGVEYEPGFLAGNEYLRAAYKSRRLGKIFKSKKTISLASEGDSTYTDVRTFPDPVPALTDIKLTVLEVSATVGCWGTLCLLLVDEEYIDPDYLDMLS